MGSGETKRRRAEVRNQERSSAKEYDRQVESEKRAAEGEVSNNKKKRCVPASLHHCSPVSIK